MERRERRLKNNYEAAFVQLRSKEKSLKKQGADIMEPYGNIFKDYEQKSFIKKVESRTAKNNGFYPISQSLDQRKTQQRSVLCLMLQCDMKAKAWTMPLM